ncbi:MAG TPA: folylpolyglutamate synthase/dihydrofolate synthase family protein [Pirellulales bacterium]|nr:folylpolyglutamate synthase/dihydrofolate synthase family protein [Pirellulales bacterium]
MDSTIECPGYQAAIDLLLGRINYERAASVTYGDREFKLDRMHDLLARLDHPQRRVPAIHITGTKGKGSTAAMIAGVLSAAGLRTGLFSSPHLDRIEERLAIDGQPCTPEQFVRLAERVRPIVADMDLAAERCDPPETGPTYFELITAMAWLHFVDQQIDVAVLEVGMGGRLDSTNICSPAVSIITSISYDHTKQLGSTLAAIAGEKAGIIKPGVPVVSGVIDDEPRNVIRRVALERGSRLIELGIDFDYRYQAPVDARGTGQGGSIDFYAPAGSSAPRSSQVSLGLLGRHQGANAAIVLETIEQLRRQQWSISDEAMRRGLRDVRLPARIELVERRPAIVIDGAHNAASMAALLATLEESFPATRRTLIFATTREKDLSGMLALALPKFDRVVFTRYQSNPRGVPAEELLELARDLGATHVAIEPTPVAAWDAVRGHLAGDDLLCVTGSFFIAAELRQEILRTGTPQALSKP